MHLLRPNQLRLAERRSEARSGDDRRTADRRHSPYAKRGVLWETHRRHYGPDGDPLILVAQGTSREFNPSLKQSVVDRALERDRAAASAEYLAQFRADIDGFVSFEVVQGCVGDHVEMAPISTQRYSAFVDPSAAPPTAFTMAVGHRDGERVVIDATREVRPPFSPTGGDRRLRNSAEELSRLESERRPIRR